MPESLLKELSINMAPPGDTVDEITKNIGNIANLTTSTDGIPIRYKEVSQKSGNDNISNSNNNSDVVISKVVIAESVIKDDKIEPKVEQLPAAPQLPPSQPEHIPPPPPARN
ncbi:unnamed protein product [[Candida] boidinii]|nr:unnamed protein product [[Candida] boidinii]